MIEENGHIWDGEGENRCHHCQFKRRQYLEFKEAMERAEKEGDEEQRDTMYKAIVCPGRGKPADFSHLPKPGSRPENIAVLQLDFWDEDTKRWGMLLDYKFNDPALAKRIKETVDRMMAEAGIKDRREN